MTIARRIAAVLAAPAVLVAASLVLAPSVAMADGGSHVESIAAKGHFSPVVPVEWGLGLGVAAAVLALGMERRSRR